MSSIHSVLGISSYEFRSSALLQQWFLLWDALVDTFLWQNTKPLRRQLSVCSNSGYGMVLQWCIFLGLIIVFELKLSYCLCCFSLQHQIGGGDWFLPKTVCRLYMDTWRDCIFRLIPSSSQRQCGHVLLLNRQSLYTLESFFSQIQ